MSAPENARMTQGLDRSFVEETLSNALIDLYRLQSPEGRAALLGFFHLIDPTSSNAVTIRLCRAGVVTLTVQVPVDDAG